MIKCRRKCQRNVIAYDLTKQIYGARSNLCPFPLSTKLPCNWNCVTVQWCFCDASHNFSERPSQAKKNFTFLHLCQEGPLFAPSSTTQVSWKVISGRLLCSSSSLATVGLRFLFDLSTWLFIFLKHLEFVFNCRVPNTWEIKVTCNCEEVDEFYSKPSTRWKPLREVSPTSKRKKPLTELRFDFMYFRRIQPNTRVEVNF